MGWGRIQRAGAVALVLLPLAAAALHARCSPDVPFLPSARGAAWIMPPAPVSAAIQQWGLSVAPVAAFVRRFELPAQPGQAAVDVRALRRFRLFANGVLVAAGDGARWRQVRHVDVSDRLRPGENVVRVEVENLRGPPLLELSVQGLPDSLASGPAWKVWQDGAPQGSAIAADDTRTDPAAAAVETPAEALGRSVVPLAALFAVGAFAVAVGSRLLQPGQLAHLPRVALAAATLLWTWLFAAKLVRIPLALGFDARHHVAYVEALRAHHALPLATDGWSMYHPPLFYVVAATLAGLGESALAALPWLCGLGNVFVAHALARRLFPADVRVELLAVLFAASLPMNLYVSAYFSNEAPHALLVGLALLASVDGLLAPSLRARHLVLVGAGFGLAALTKFTALVVFPVALFFLAIKSLAVERVGALRTGLRVGAAAGVAGAIAGWFYLRNALHFGRLLVGNWNLPGADQIWWQQPGFHTRSWYTGFGESLRHPYLAGFHSFWDGIYSTLWGDGGIAGRVLPAQRHGFWSYDFMSLGYLLAAPATLLVCVGAIRCVRIALADRDAARRAALSFVTTAAWAVGFSIFYLTLSLPFFAQAKAFYGLCMVGPLAVFFAAGAARVDEALSRPGRGVLRLAFGGGLAATLGSFFLAYAA
jgi:hypothetical protein